MATQEHHTFLFADLCGYAALSEAAGDEAAADLAIGFSQRVAGLAAQHGVEFVRRIGDAVMLHGESAASVLLLGIRLMEELSGKNGIPQVHAGIHTGPAVARAGDWWGCTVNVAARVSTLATKGQLLVTETTRRAAGQLAALPNLGDVGVMRLKNISAPVRVYSAGGSGRDVARASQARLVDETGSLRRESTGALPEAAFAQAA